MIVNTYYTGPLGTNTYLAYDETKKAFIVDPGGYSDALVNDVNATQIGRASCRERV